MKNVGEIKITVLGDKSVGKSAICSSFCYPEKALSRDYTPTIGVDMFKPENEIEVDGSRVAWGKIWDVAGWRKTLDMLPSYLRGAKVVIFVFDVTKAESFDNLNTWLEDAKKYAPNAAKVIVGNKIDLDNRVVNDEDAQKFAEENDALYFEVSARDKTNIHEPFQQGARQYYDSLPEKKTKKRGKKKVKEEVKDDDPIAAIRNYATILSNLPTEGLHINDNTAGIAKGKALTDIFKDESAVTKESIGKILSGDEYENLTANRNKLHISFFKLKSRILGNKNPVTEDWCQSQTEVLLSEAYNKMSS